MEKHVEPPNDDRNDDGQEYHERLRYIYIYSQVCAKSVYGTWNGDVELKPSPLRVINRVYVCVIIFVFLILGSFEIPIHNKLIRVCVCVCVNICD